jgi:putative sigma-54 modulation protein
MKLILSTHNVTLTDAMEQHVLHRLEHMEHLDRWLLDARVSLEKDHTAHLPENQFKCGIRLGLRGKDLYGESKNADLYHAIDAAAKKVEVQIRKKHSVAKAKKHKLATRQKESRRSKVDKA